MLGSKADVFRNRVKHLQRSHVEHCAAYPQGRRIVDTFLSSTRESQRGNPF